MIPTAVPTCADDAPTTAANQVAGLFTQSCMQFAGDTESLRDWAKGADLKALPAEARKYFLNGLSGIVFDASNDKGKFVLISYDGGSCSVIAERASGPVAITDLERDMNSARIAFTLVGENTDPEEKALQHREYAVSLGRRQWRLLVSTVKNPDGGQAMLTATAR